MGGLWLHLAACPPTPQNCPGSFDRRGRLCLQGGGSERIPALRCGGEDDSPAPPPQLSRSRRAPCLPVCVSVSPCPRKATPGAPAPHLPSASPQALGNFGRALPGPMATPAQISGLGRRGAVPASSSPARGGDRRASSVRNGVAAETPVCVRVSRGRDGVSVLSVHFNHV